MQKNIFGVKFLGNVEFIYYKNLEDDLILGRSPKIITQKKPLSSNNLLF